MQTWQVAHLRHHILEDLQRNAPQRDVFLGEGRVLGNMTLSVSCSENEEKNRHERPFRASMVGFVFIFGI